MVENKKRKSSNAAEKDDHRAKKPTNTDVEDSNGKRIIGPALPPPKQTLLDTNSEEVTNGADRLDDSDGDSDDDIGPILPPALTDKIEPNKGTNGTSHMPPTVHFSEEQFFPHQKQRDEWMLQPPRKADSVAKPDPTKLRHRMFQSGRSGRGPPVEGRLDMSWTENPEQKLERLKDEVLGVKTSTPVVNERSYTEEPRITEAIQERIQKYNEMTRRSVTQNSKQHPGNSDDDPSTRAFDREKDMATSSNISNAQRRHMLDNATKFNSRFTGGRLL